MLMFIFVFVLLFSTRAFCLKSTLDCRDSPQACRPPDYCKDDGFGGSCISENNEWNSALQQPSIEQEQWGVGSSPNGNTLTTNEYEHLYNMVLHVQAYLRSNNLEFSDLSDAGIEQLATDMANLFIKQEHAHKKKRMDRLLSLLMKEKADLDQRGISLRQLTEEQKQNLIDTVVDKFLQSEEKNVNENPKDEFSRPSEGVSNINSRSVVKKPVRLSSSERLKSPSKESSPYKPDNNSKNVVGDANSVSQPDDLEFRVTPKQDGEVEARSQDDSPVQSVKEKGLNEEGPSQGLSTKHVEFAKKTKSAGNSKKEETYIIVIIIVAIVVVCIALIVVAIYCMRSSQAQNKLLGAAPLQSGNDYQALCRQHYASKSTEATEVKQPFLQHRSPNGNSTTPARVFSPNAQQRSHTDFGSRNSSLSSWSEEPVTSSMDIMTGHAILSYMEDHLNNKDRLTQEWVGLCNYKADNVSTKVARSNPRKNRSPFALPYDHNRVKLNVSESATDSDYINASYIIDNDPRWPVYIATQGPLSSTIPDFWQMVWERGSTVIVMLAPLIEEGTAQCARYWPDELEGSCSFGNYEINLVSEHVWRDDYLVRSLYLKNLKSNHTRTVTQFHFLSWPHNGIPTSSRQLLELRRKVSKCYRGNALSPAVVHCSDGCGRTGSYILIDLVLARMLKGTSKEIDIAATLEHLRDQRAGGMVSSKEQLKFALHCVADEVNAILKVMLQ